MLYGIIYTSLSFLTRVHNDAPALKKAAMVWDPATIAAFVKNPQGLAKGTRMISPGPLRPADPPARHR